MDRMDSRLDPSHAKVKNIRLRWKCLETNKMRQVTHLSQNYGRFILNIMGLIYVFYEWIYLIPDQSYKTFLV